MTNNPTIDGVSEDPRQWSDRQILDFIGVALRNVDPLGSVVLSEIRQGFEYMLSQQPAVERKEPIKTPDMPYKMLPLEEDGWFQCVNAYEAMYPLYDGFAVARHSKRLIEQQESTIVQLQARVQELESGPGEPFQSRVQPWMIDCFGPAIAGDREERNHRFLEEALELVQACGCSANEAHQLVEYVYGRPAGEPAQEVGGVMVTLAALCLANSLDMHANGETELARIWTKVDQIRAKQAAKPAMSPLPGVYPERQLPAPVAVVLPTTDQFKDAFRATGHVTYEQAWELAEAAEACLDATAALNAPKPTEWHDVAGDDEGVVS